MTVPQQTQEFLDKMNATSSSLLDNVADIAIVTDDDYESALEVLKTVKSMANELEAVRTSITKPINENLRAVNALFSEPSSRLQIAEKRLKSLTVKYVADKREEQQRMIAEAAALLVTNPQTKQSTPESAQAYVASIAQVAAIKPPVVSGVSFSERWDWSLVDLSLVPREYLCIDAAKVNAAIKGGARQIPGLNIFPVTQTRVVASK